MLLVVSLSYMWLLICAALLTPSVPSAPPAMSLQSHLADTIGAALIGLVFSAVWVPPPRQCHALSSEADTAGYMGSHVSKRSRTTSTTVTQIASF
jgi:hypothetical protein